jgi:hypothetical protein
MRKVALRHSNTIIIPLTFDSQASNQTIFEPSSYSQKRLIRELESGRLLNGYGFQHKKFGFNEWDFSLSTDTLDNTKIAFIETWLDAKHKYIAESEDGTNYDNYIEVLTPGYDKSSFEDLIELPELSLTVVTREKV